jgi:putative drug exporter of the RND superfamily
MLMVVFRSIAIPIKAAVMNLAVAAASFGVLAAVFQWGWGAGLIGATADTPFLAFLPIMLLAVLFGLSMDYQVFLVSRMREEWLRIHDNTAAVTLGLSETGKVITAAAMIMVCVFLAFVSAGEPALKMSGVGMAVAVFLDAFLVRSLLVPALMQVLGNWNWWVPRWLDRILPRVHV